MSSSPPPTTSPSHRSPLTLLSKLKRQLSKPPVTQHQKQPIEHQYLPIPTVSFSESVHSNQTLSTYSCSNNSSSRSSSSFVLIDHNEEPASFGADEYRPFLPLIIQYERLQQQQRLAPPRLAPTGGHRARILSPPNEPPSPTSTASSKSLVTPIFASSFFDEEDDDGIMTMSNSEVGSISEYSLPSSLSAYMDEARNVRSRRGRKSSCQTSSDSESRHRRGRGISIRTPPPRSTSRKSFPPISPPPSCPLPETPASVEPTSTAIRPKTPLATSDGESSSSQNRDRTSSLRNEITTPPSLVPALAQLSPASAISLDAKIKAKTRSEPPAPTILSNLEIIDSPAYAFTTTTTPDESSDQKEDDDDNASPSTRTSISTPTTPTPRQYGIGRQVLRGSGSGRDFDFIVSSSKRLSASVKSVKRDSTGKERKDSRLSFGPESALDSKAEDENVEQLDKPSAEEGCSEVNHDPTQTQTETQIPSPTPRRRVNSDDSNSNLYADVSGRTSHHEKYREESNPEWTLFLGIPRNAPPPSPPVVLSTGLPVSTGEPNAIPNSASTVFSTTATTMTQRHSLLTTHFLAPTMSMRNRTKSDSALLASASADGAEERGDEERSKTKTKRGEEDWTLSLPLVLSPTAPSSTSSAEVPRGSKDFDAPSGSGSQAMVEEECQPRVGEVDDLVITVEDADKGKQKGRQVSVCRSGEEEDQDPLILRVPRIVRSCSSYPLLSTTSPTLGRMKKSSTKSSTKWMGTGATSTPNLRRGVSSSCTLEEEVMFMLLGDSAPEEDDDNESRTKSRASSLSATTKKDLARKKMATLDEDLARFNALLKNRNLSGTGNRPASSIIESAMAAAATATPTTMKTKAVTLNSHPEPVPTPTTSTLPPLRKKSTSYQTLPILKPVLKHAKSCEPFLGSPDGGVAYSPSSPPSTSPVMRFPPSPGPLTISTQTSLLPFAHYNTKFVSSSSPTSILKTKRSLEFEMSGSRGGVPTVPFRAVSMGSMRSTPSPVESSSGFSTSQTERQHQYHYQKRSPPAHLPRLHTPVSSSSSASSPTSASSSQRHITVSINDNDDLDADIIDSRRRSISPPLPSPIASESSSALPTPLASAFPLPPSSPISISELDGVVAFQQKLREFENAKGREQQQPLQQQREKYQTYKPPSTASSFSSFVSNASSTATVVPTGDQKIRVRSVITTVGGGGSGREMGREGEGDVQEEDKNSMCSTTYYSARSSFSSRSPGV